MRLDPANEPKASDPRSQGCDAQHDNPARPDPESALSALPPAEDWALAVVMAGVVFPAPRNHRGIPGPE
jgi:hypothetical protein